MRSTGRKTRKSMMGGSYLTPDGFRKARARRISSKYGFGARASVRWHAGIGHWVSSRKLDRKDGLRYFSRLNCAKSIDEVLMPNIKSAKKRMELSRAANTRNRAKRSQIRTAIRRVREAESPESAQVHLQKAVALLDRAAGKRLIHPNRVARLKSQLTRRVKEMNEET
jgi:small subunit ribosomal protein S20